ncbi:MAG: HIP---CoA ligase [Actinomycetota bacterium]|jgi:acyl-CoA synthetase (AMP-forming)/AMP-acid ligase II|nr:HIP---CoA ligase [Actinomycetota bacterium]
MLPLTVPAVLRAAATDSADVEAIVAGDVRLTFALLQEQVTAFARALIADGVSPGDRVAIWAPNTDRWVVAALGALSAGAVLVPVNTRFKGEEAQHVLASTAARVLVVDDTFLDAGRVAMLAKAGALPDLRTTVRTDSNDWESFVDRGSAVPRQRADEAAAAVEPDDISDIIFTSGTTGRPKGAMVTHGQSVRLFRDWATNVGLIAGDRMLVVSPFFHSFGYKAGIVACLTARATLLPVKVLDVEETLGLIEREKATVVPGAPTLYATFLESTSLSLYDVSSVRLAVTGASVVPTELIRRMRDELGFASVLTAYGLTECCGYATGCRPGDPDEVVSLTSGRAVDGVEVRVVAPGGGPLPAGEAGEVLVRGYNVMVGYWNDPDATAATIDADGWLHTGDVGKLDEAGNLSITDRLKDMYVVGGFNAYPAEVEQVLVRHEAVSEAAVIGVPDARLGEVGKAFVVARGGAAPTEDELIGWCKELLAGYKVPRSVVLVDSLPRNATGKVDKKVLAASSG